MTDQRVVLLCPDLDEVGGIGAVSRMILRALQSTGARGEVWSLKGRPGDRDASGEHQWPRRYAGGSPWRFASWGAGAALADGHGMLVIATHLHLAPVAMPLLARGASLVVFVHGIEAWVPLTPIRRAALGRARLLVANSRFTVSRFLQANPSFSTSEIAVCPLGAPEVDWSSSARQPIQRAPFALLTARMSADERHKGHDVLLELWPRVMAQVPHARLVIVGDGDDRDRLERKAADVRLAGAVSFLGCVTDDVLHRLYAECAFFVMPSGRLEGFGLAFLEAMRAGKACIGGRGAAEEVIDDGITGRLVGDDREQLLHALLAFFGDPQRCAQMGAAGLARYRQRFTESLFHRRFLDSLQNAAEPASGRGAILQPRNVVR